MAILIRQTLTIGYANSEIVIIEFCQLFYMLTLCFERCNSDRERPSINKQRDRIYKYYDDFYQIESEKPFHKAANVEEIKIETANISPIEIAKDILKRF
ncbi:MAG: hypothetical protein WBF33_06880 [Candidatus Nitrosopolaris sp.]